MRNKWYVILFFLVSCSRSSNEFKESDLRSVKNQENAHLSIIEQLDGLLSGFINKSEYVFIYRTGSIEFSSDYSVLCIPKKEINNTVLHCKYFMLNDLENLEVKKAKVFDSDEPNILGFSFNLDNDNVEGFDFKFLASYSQDDLKEKYIIKKLSEQPGEGHCNNFYFISSNSSDSIYVLDSNSGEKEIVYFESLYKQISPSEYIQTESLHTGCHNNALSTWIELNKGKNSFLLKHGDQGRYW